jgi:hypothetical protein
MGDSEETDVKAVKEGCVLNDVSLRTIIASNKFRDYEKEMARELQRRRAVPPLNHYLLRVALQSVAFHIAMGAGNIDNPFQHEREKALEYLRTLAPDPQPAQGRRS